MAKLFRCAACGDIKKTVCRKAACKPPAPLALTFVEPVAPMALTHTEGEQ